MVNLSYFTLSTSALIISTNALPNPWNFSQTNNLARGTASQWQFKPRSEFYSNNYYGSRNKIPEKYVKTGAQTQRTSGNNGAASSAATLNSIFNWNNFSNRNLNRPTSVWSRPSYAVAKEQQAPAQVPVSQYQRSIPNMRPMPGSNWDQPPVFGPGMQQAIPDMRPMPGSDWAETGPEMPDLPSSRPMPGTDWDKTEEPISDAEPFIIEAEPKAAEPAAEPEPVQIIQEPEMPDLPSSRPMPGTNWDEPSIPVPEVELELDETEPLSPIESELTEVTQTVTQVETAVENIMNEVSDIEAQVAILKEMSETNLTIPDLSAQVEAVIENVEAEFDEIEDQVSILEDIEADLEIEEELIEEESDESVEDFEDAYEDIVEEIVADSVAE